MVVYSVSPFFSPEKNLQNLLRNVCQTCHMKKIYIYILISLSFTHGGEKENLPNIYFLTWFHTSIKKNVLFFLLIYFIYLCIYLGGGSRHSWEKLRNKIKRLSRQDLLFSDRKQIRSDTESGSRGNKLP